MSNTPIQRKTYMMLSKENAEKFIIEPETHKILQILDNIHETKVKKEEGDNIGDVYKVGYDIVKNACYTYRFPDEFINSKNKRWIEIHHCKVTFREHASTDLIIHSDIIQRDPYLDCSVMNVNETRTKYKKYEYTQQNHYFTIWFTSFAKPKEQIKDENIAFMVEMMLIY